MDEILRNGFRLGMHRISPLNGWIEGPDGIKHVQPKVMDVLLCLARHAGEVVERDALVDEVWDGRPATDDVLTRCISELRNVLGDDPGDPTYVQTIPKRGYRLIAEVTGHVVSAENSRLPAEVNSLWAELKKRKVVKVALAYIGLSWLLLQVADTIFSALRLPDWSMTIFLFVLGIGFVLSVAVAWLTQLVPEPEFASLTANPRYKWIGNFLIVAVLAISIGLLMFYREFIERDLFPDVPQLSEVLTLPAVDRNSVAVLRFAGFGVDTAISNGFGEHLLNLFARVSGLKVPSRQATWPLSDRNLNPTEIASTLRVRYVLEGSVQAYDGRIRITAQLIDGTTGDHVWSEHYDDQLTAGNYFEIQDDIAQRVIDQFEVTVSNAAAIHQGNRSTESDEALTRYLEGREELNKPKTEASLTAAVNDFQEAVRGDA